MSGTAGPPPTSEIGMMYRNMLQQRGVPFTPQNMSRLIAESQHNPGLMAPQGLTVQQAAPPPNMQAAGHALPTPGMPNSAPMPMPVPPMPPSSAAQPNATPMPAPSPAPSAPPPPQPSPQLPLPPPPGMQPQPMPTGPQPLGAFSNSSLGLPEEDALPGSPPAGPPQPTPAPDTSAMPMTSLSDGEDVGAGLATQLSNGDNKNIAASILAGGGAAGLAALLGKTLGASGGGSQPGFTGNYSPGTFRMDTSGGGSSAAQPQSTTQAALPHSATTGALPQSPGLPSPTVANAVETNTGNPSSSPIRPQISSDGKMRLEHDTNQGGALTKSNSIPMRDETSGPTIPLREGTQAHIPPASSLDRQAALTQLARRASRVVR